jgi:hypothetical protein
MLIATEVGFRIQEIDAGWRVRTVDGMALGIVEGVHPNHLIVIATDLAGELFFIPTEAVTDVENDIVYLDVQLADTTLQDWELLPDLDDAPLEDRPRTRLTHPIRTVRIGSLIVVTAALVMAVSLALATTQLIVVAVALAVIGALVQARSESILR